jgi:hypothetical protein
MHTHVIERRKQQYYGTQYNKTNSFLTKEKILKKEY